MRARIGFVIAFAALPALLPAQTGRRVPVIPPGAARPPRPAEKPPTAPGIHERRYRSSRFSIESYPLLSLVQTDRYVTDSAATTSLLVGSGSRLAFRVDSAISVTGDVTSSFLGGPFRMMTGDIGARYHLRPGSRTRTFVDVRMTYALTYDSYAQPYGGSGFVIPPYESPVSGFTTSRGWGGLVGTGFETALSDRWAYSAGASFSQPHMGAVKVGTTSRREWNYTANVVRFTFGVRYTPRRYYRNVP